MKRQMFLLESKPRPSTDGRQGDHQLLTVVTATISSCVLLEFGIGSCEIWVSCFFFAYFQTRVFF